MSDAMTYDERALARLDAKISKVASGCWLWMGSGGGSNYGKMQFRGRIVQAHRASYELHRGPIPVGFELDHLCRVRACVNPAHLEPVTHAENARRSPLVGTNQRSKTHCPKGHPYDEENTILYGVRRSCRACHNARTPYKPFWVDGLHHKPVAF